MNKMAQNDLLATAKRVFNLLDVAGPCQFCREEGWHGKGHSAACIVRELGEVIAEAERFGHHGH